MAVSYNKRIPLFTLLLLKLLCCNYFSSWLEGSEAGGGGHMFTGIITGPRKPFQYLNITTDLKKKVLQQDNRGASPHHKLLLIQVACSAKVCTIGKLRCNPRVPQALALPHTTVHYPHALFLSDVWQLKIRLLLYYNAHIGTSPKHTSIQTLTYIRKITEHWGLYINRNNGQI